MKTLLILERKDLAKIRKARDEVWTAYLGIASQIDDNVADRVSWEIHNGTIPEMKMLLNVKRLMDELLVEAEHDQG